jgi:beta-phosphoglucomutase
MEWSPRAVIFDFDGVLVNSEPLHYRAFSEVLRGEKIELSEEEYYKELIGTDDKGAIRHVFARRNLPLDNKTMLRILARKTEQMMDLIDRLRPAALPGADEFVRGLWRKYPLAICSGALREEIEALLEGIGLRDCFQTIIAAEDVTKGKPDPEGYLLTTRMLSERMKQDLKPSDILIIEDAPAVIERVRPLGFKVLGVATSYFIDKLSGADWAVRSLRPDEVAEVLPDLKLGPE